MKLLKLVSADPSVDLIDEFSFKNFFFVKKNNRSIRVAINEILWVKADGPSVEITYTTGSVITYANLSSFEKQIQHPNLARVHRSYIVNLINVLSFDDQFIYVNHKNKEVRIPFGRTYRKDALRPFLQLKSD